MCFVCFDHLVLFIGTAAKTNSSPFIVQNVLDKNNGDIHREIFYANLLKVVFSIRVNLLILNYNL